MRIIKVIICALSTTTVAGCAVVPSLPTDVEYPINEITRYAACQLRSGYTYLYQHRSDYPTFRADEYAVTIELLPKADTDFNARAGVTDKSSLIAKTFSSGALGASPGAGLPGAGVDTTGHVDAAVYYTANSTELIHLKKPLDCEYWSESQPQLVHNLEIEKWLLRIAKPSNADIGPFVEDKHNYTAEITIQWDAGGLFTYNFPLGSAFASGAGRFKIDESLLITVVRADTKPISVVSLPLIRKNDRFAAGQPLSSAAVSATTQQRLDMLQLQQSIQNLQITIPRQ